MSKRLPARFAPYLFALLLSGLMSLIVSGIATVRALGVDADFPAAWFWAWLSSWAIAFPSVLVVSPLVRRMVAKLTHPPGA